jgi:hypothetical protein
MPRRMTPPSVPPTIAATGVDDASEDDGVPALLLLGAGVLPPLVTELVLDPAALLFTDPGDAPSPAQRRTDQQYAHAIIVPTYERPPAQSRGHSRR